MDFKHKTVLVTCWIQSRAAGPSQTRLGSVKPVIEKQIGAAQFDPLLPKVLVEKQQQFP